MSDDNRSTHRAPAPRVSLDIIVKRWTRPGCVGFGGPTTHIALLRRMCVEERQWIDAKEFEDAAHEPLTKRVHDRVDDDALRAVAFGIFSAFAAVLSRWVAQGERPLPKG